MDDEIKFNDDILCDITKPSRDNYHTNFTSGDA